MKFCVNDFTIYYEKYGNGNKNILILPGWGDTRPTFNHLISLLEEMYTIYIIDYPGFGQSPFPNRDLTIEDYANLVKDFIKNKQIDNPIIIAHSFGGRIVIELFTNHKDLNIKNLILIDIAGIKAKKSFYQKMKEKIYKILKKIGKILPKKFRKRYLEKLIQIFGSSDYAALSQNIRNTFINIINRDQRNDIKNIDADTLIIWGEMDRDVPVEDGRYIKENIKDSGIVIIPKGGHFPYLDHAYYVNKIIIEYLKSL